MNTDVIESPVSQRTDAHYYNSLAWWIDAEGWTIIANSEGEVARWSKTMEEKEVILWCDGFETGLRRGIEQGKIAKSGEIRRALGL